MEIIRIPRIMRDTCKKNILKGRTVGFVPTMGALHDGHLSLVKRALMENDVTVVSIFVNPIQFGPAEDLRKYPRDIEGDMEKIRHMGIDTLFLPDDSAMYPEGFSTFIDTGRLSEKLCGAFRPGHFRGVATVVAKLFNVVDPTRAYFGQKDFQQALVIKRMVRDLNFIVDVVICPTIRESDGLAMSSRNGYLDEARRKAAPALYRAMSLAAGAIRSGTRSASSIKALMRDALSKEPLITRVEYCSVYDPSSLDEIEEIKGEILLAVAARLGDTRLIDNMLVDTR